MSLAALRAHVWKSGNDILLYYRANGRKEIPTSRPAPLPGAANGAAGDGAAAGTASAPTSGITSVAGPAAAAAS